MMINSHTPYLENALDKAREEAQACGADAITPAHLFLGLMDESAGFSSIVLTTANIKKDYVRKIIHKRFGVFFDKDNDEIGLSAQSLKALESAKHIAGAEQVNTHHLLMAILFISSREHTELTFVLHEAGHSPTEIMEYAQKLIAERYSESEQRPRSKKRPGHTSKNHHQSSSGTPSHSMPQVLSAFGKDLTTLAEKGQLDPVIGRDVEIQRAIRTLLRRRKSNPCFVGKAGVGKSAVVEGLAQKIADGTVPEALKNCRIIEINTGALLSGTKYRGDFEERMTRVIKEATDNQNFILFFDEMHTLLDGSGVESSGMSASNLLKPALARGSIRTIGATTVEEYRRHVEKDPALERRFQKVMIGEPSIQETVDILANLRPRYEDHHGITIEDDALLAAAELSQRYLNDRQLPDKAVDVLDEASSMIQLSTRFQMTKDDIAEVIAEMTGIPVGAISETESQRLLALESRLHSRVIGQTKAVIATANAIRRNRAGLNDRNRPIGSFLFLGPTGVGKTELSLALSETLFQCKESLIRLNMSEYMENASVSKLLGAAPGYVGYESHEALTEKIALKPHSVVLFDEIEKAHPDVWNLLLQILDAGTLTSSSGHEVSFKNAVVIMTSNIGANHLVSPSRSLGFTQNPETESGKGKVMEELKKTFRPEFLNRIDEIIVFDKLTRDDTIVIVEMMLHKVSEKALVAELTLEFTDEAVEALAEKGYDPVYGARPLRRLIQREIEDKLANKILDGSVSAGDHVVCSFSEAFEFEVKSKITI